MNAAFFQVLMVTAFTFMSTNTDNLVIYTGFISAKQGSKVSLLISYYVAMTLLLIIIFCLSLSFSKIPEHLIKYLGLILSTVGIMLLVKHLRTKEDNPSVPHYKTRSIELMLGITMLMDSFDTVSVFVPLFADSSDKSDVAVAVSFVTCFFIWGLSGLYISRLRVFKFLTRHKEIVTPVIMILVGIYIFINTGGDVEL